MIDLLLVNPKEHADEILRVFDEQKLTVHIVDDIAEFNLITDGTTYKSAIAWGASGQTLVDNLSSQILLKNVQSDLRTQHYLKVTPAVENCRLYNIMSYKGRHVLLEAFIFKAGQWLTFKNQSLPFFNNGVEQSFNILDNNGIINGPTQVYLNEDNSYQLELSLIDMKKLNLLSRSLRDPMEVWPMVLAVETTNPKKALHTYYDWVERTGSSKKYPIT